MAVGIVYDPIYLEHETGTHVENKARLMETIDLLRQSGVLAKLVEIPARAATADEIGLVHTPQHYAKVENTSKAGDGWLDPDTVVSPRSFEVALTAVGGVLEATDAVLSGKVNSAFALVRPPGHHATPTRAMGFCLFNNIAIAAKRAVEEKGLERVLIVDFDVHHGNGTQDAFYDDPRVLYFSTHEYPFYPGTGFYDETGTGKGKGFTVNVPLPAGGGDAEYLRAFEEILVPVARRYSPELVLVSAGYDAHWLDQLAMMNVSINGYGRMIEMLKGIAAELAKGRLVLCLEGGYHLRALPESVKATFEVLLGKTGVSDPLGLPASQRVPALESLFKAIKALHQI